MPGSHVCPRPRATFPAAEVRVHRQWLQGRSSEPEPWVPAAWEQQQPRGPGTVCPRSVGLVRTEAPQQGILRCLGRAGRRVGVGDLSGPPLCPEVVTPQWASGARPALGETLEGPPGLCLGCHPVPSSRPLLTRPSWACRPVPSLPFRRFPPGLSCSGGPQVGPGHCPLARPCCESCSPLLRAREGERPLSAAQAGEAGRSGGSHSDPQALTGGEGALCEPCSAREGKELSVGGAEYIRGRTCYFRTPSSRHWSSEPCW